MTKITDKVYVDKTQVIAIVDNSKDQPYGLSLMGPSNPGTLITLKNGHSVFVPQMTPQEVYKKLEWVE